MRIVAALLAAVLAFTPGAAALADASAEAATMPAHVDATGTHHDDSAHSDDCSMCRHLATPASDRHVRHAAVPAKLCKLEIRPVSQRQVSQPRSAAASPRAPPALAA